MKIFNTKYTHTHTHTHTPADTPADTTTIAVSVCPRCGTVEKSGETSCCGRGGSWFKSCGSGGNTKRHHTWSEGIQACKTRSQSKTVIGQQLNLGQQKNIDFSQGAHVTNYKTVMAATKTFVFTSVSTSTPMLGTAARTLTAITSTYTPMTPSTRTSASTSIIKQGCGPRCVNLLTITININVLLVCHFILADLFD